MVIDISYVAIQSVVMRRLWCSPPMWRCKHTSPTRIAKATRSKWISGSTTDRLVDDSTATMRAKQRQPPTAMPLTAATAVAAAARQPAPRHCHQRVCTYPPILSLFTCAGVCCRILAQCACIEWRTQATQWCAHQTYQKSVIRERGDWFTLIVYMYVCAYVWLCQCCR